MERDVLGGRGHRERNPKRGAKVGAGVIDVHNLRAAEVVGLVDVVGAVLLDAELGGVEHAGEAVAVVGVAAGDEDFGVREDDGGGVVEARDGGGRHLLEAALPGVVEDGGERWRARDAPACGAGLGAVDDEDLPGRKDEHIAHDARGGHGVDEPIRVRVCDGEAAAGLKSRGEFVVNDVLPGAGRGAAADEDFGGCEAVGGGEGEEDGGAGGRVVAGAAGKGGEFADLRAGFVVEEDGVLVGEDEEVAVGGEVDERVEVVLGPGFVGSGE